MQSDMAETAIECFRKLSLPLGNEQILELMPQIFFDLLAKWLNSYTPSHNGALEIICSLSDQKLATKVKIANASGCLE